MTDTIQLVTEGGIAATHAEVEDFRPLVGPSTGDEFNTIKAALIPIACWRVDDIRFEFDSSFIQPGIQTELKHLAELLKKHPPASMAKNATPPDTVGCPLSIFGHADPVGDDEYNKQLSGRRAMALYGLLNRDVELWDELYKNPMGNDKWGKKSLQTMVRETSDPKRTDEPNVSIVENNATHRKTLYEIYMDMLCEQVDDKGNPKQDKDGKIETLKLDKKDFLAQGQDKNGKGDYQGCSEFNPILLFSQEVEKAFQEDKDKTQRNEANAPNRRVMVLIFRKGTKVDPNRWPCPRAKEGTAGCKKRFWSDGEKRRTTKLSDKQRKFEEARDTFACRFYDRLLAKSPCESTRTSLRSTYALDCLTIFARVNPFRAFRSWIWHVFGDDIPVEAIERLFLELNSRTFQSPLHFNRAKEKFTNPLILVSKDIPGGERVREGIIGVDIVYGGYSEGVIFVNETLIKSALVDQEKSLLLMAVLTEEFGHHVDHVLRNRYTDRSKYPMVRDDAPLDEGAIFAMMLAPVDDEGMSGFTYAFDRDSRPLRIESVVSRSEWGAFFPEDRIFADRKMRTAAGETVEHFAASDIEHRGGHIHFYGHEGIERTAVKSLPGWNEERRKYVYFGNWQRDYSQLGDPKVIRALGIARSTVTPLQQFHPWTQYHLEIAGVSEIGKKLIEKVCRPQDEKQYSIAQWRHSAQQEAAAWMVPALIDLLAEDKFGQGFPIIDTNGAPYNVGVYIPKEHIDNPSTIDHDFHNVDSRFRVPFNKASEGGVISEGPRFGLRQYIQQSVAFIKAELKTAAEPINDANGLSGRQLQYMHLGNALHTLEDYFAHSNFCEIFLKSRGHSVDVFIKEEQLPLSNRSQSIVPIVTGTFGGIDTAMSILGELFHHLEDAEKGPKPGPSKVNRLVIILLRRHCAPIQPLYEGFLEVEKYIALPSDIQKWVIEGFKKFIRFLRKEMAWAAAEMLLEMIIPKLCKIKGVTEADKQRALRAVDQRNVDQILNSLFDVLGVNTVDKDFVRAAAALVDIDFRGDGIFSLRDPSTVAEVLEELAGLYQRIESQGTNEPTHTQLSKDHSTNPIHLLAAELAVWAVNKIAVSISGAWDKNDEDHIKHAIDECNGHVDQIIRHPKYYEGTYRTDVEKIVGNWEAANQDTVTRLEHKNKQRPLDLNVLDERGLFIKNTLRNLRVLLQKLSRMAQ